MSGSATPRRRRHAFEPVTRPSAVIHSATTSHKHHHGEWDEQLEQREQVLEDPGVDAQRERKDEQTQKHRVGVAEEGRDDDARRERELGDGIKAVQDGVARNVVDDVNHGGSSPR